METARAGLRPIRSWLYAPGNKPKVLKKPRHLRRRGDPGSREGGAAGREGACASWVRADRLRPLVFVRVATRNSGLAEADVGAAVGPGLDGLRVPKVEDAATVQRVDAWLATTSPWETGAPQGVAPRMRSDCDVA